MTLRAGSNPGDRTRYYSASTVQRLRGALRRALEPPELGNVHFGDGLHLSPVDPTEAICKLRSVRLKQGYILRGYHYIEGSNGNGFVYAIPEATHLPDPWQHVRRSKEVVPGVHLPCPEPPNALPHFMDAIEGDGSPWSFLEASILMRELEEFGAIWHGCDWSDHEILYADPLDRQNPMPRQLREYGPWSREHWHWLASKPEEWRPCVRLDGQCATAEFISFSAAGQCRIEKHVDTYQSGSMHPASASEGLAYGPVGFVY